MNFNKISRKEKETLYIDKMTELQTIWKNPVDDDWDNIKEWDDKLLERSIKSTISQIRFEKGIYVYVGSAQNNLEKRIERHYSNNKKLWWHIDYFLKNRYTKIKKTLYKIAGKEQEHKLAFELNKIGIPVEKFGSSDCKCSSHLFKIKNEKYLKVLKMETFEK